MAVDPSRTRVNVFLALFLPVLLIDGIRPMTGAHAWLEDRLDYALDVSGLWQGPWRLFGPDVKKDNLRLTADVVFTDHTKVTWQSPDWSERSAAWKFVHAREMNYYGNILKAGQDPAWEGLAAYLARTVPHPPGGSAPVEGVALMLRGATIPDPDADAILPAAPYLAFDAPAVIYVWRAPR